MNSPQNPSPETSEEQVSSTSNKSSISTMQNILNNLKELKFAEPFLEPVDWKAWGLIDYPEVIKKPMDLGTISQKVNEGEYDSIDSFIQDIQLVIDNCTTYNDKKAEVYKQAIKLQRALDREISKLKTEEKDEAAGASKEVTFPPKTARISSSTTSDKTPSVPSSMSKGKNPTADEKEKFCKSVFQLRATELGKIVELIDELSPRAIERIGKDEIDINVDNIDTATYRKVESIIRDFLSKDSKETIPGTGNTHNVASSTNSKRKRIRLHEEEEEGEEE